MTPSELLSELPLAPGDKLAALFQLRLLLICLAGHVYELRDAGDFRQFLLDLAEEARKAAQEVRGKVSAER